MQITTVGSESTKVLSNCSEIYVLRTTNKWTCSCICWTRIQKH